MLIGLAQSESPATRRVPIVARQEALLGIARATTGCIPGWPGRQLNRMAGPAILTDFFRGCRVAKGRRSRSGWFSNLLTPSPESIHGRTCAAIRILRPAEAGTRA